MNTCIICGSKVFKDKWGRIPKTCSKECHHKRLLETHKPRPRKGFIKICEFCKKEYYVSQYRSEKTKFCSRSCLAKAHLPQFREYAFQKTGRPPHTYKSITVNGKQIRVHRHVMQSHLGRKLNSSEHVHHINGNSHDNRIENLIVLSNSEHQKIEIQNRKS